MSPSVDGLADFNSNYFNNVNSIGENKVPFHEQFVDINTLPVVISDLASDVVADMNPWQATDTVWQNVRNIDYTKQISHTHNTMPFIHQDDSLDMKLVSVTPREVENNDVVVSECIIDKEEETKEFELLARPERRGGLLSVNTQIWHNNMDTLNTPDVLSVVEQLEKEKCLSPSSVSIYFTNINGGCCARDFVPGNLTKKLLFTSQL